MNTNPAPHPLPAALRTAFVVTLLTVPAAQATDNPFQIADQGTSIVVADAATHEGKCGEGKCGKNKTASAPKQTATPVAGPAPGNQPEVADDSGKNDAATAE